MSDLGDSKEVFPVGGEEQMLFEIPDDYYIIESWAFELFLGVGLLLFMIYYGDTITSPFFSLLAKPVALYGIGRSLFKTYRFYVQKDKKIQFYPSKIVRTHDGVEVKKNSLSAIYKLSHIALHRRYSGVKKFKETKSVLTMMHIFFLFPFALVCNSLIFCISIFYFKTYFPETCFLVENISDATVTIYPPSKKKNEEEFYKYFRVFSGKDIGVLRKKILITQKG